VNAMMDIKLQNITKIYKGTKKPAVNNLSLQVPKGNIITLLGPSGCGKTTTLRLIAGFERANEGTIQISGKTVSDNHTWVPPEKREIGMVFQDYALFPHLNVFDNVAFGYKERNRIHRVAEVLELVNLKNFEKRLIHELSGGQQQRVALARALTKRPSVVLLDEPFSNLDADLRVYMRIEVQRIIKEAAATAVFVSHDQKDALAISDQVVVMKEGIIQQIGTPREIYRFPENRFVASFVGQSNILEGIMGSDCLSVETKLGRIPCYHTHDACNGEKVLISVRPDSFEKDNLGSIEGIVTQFTYTGESNDAIIKVYRSNEEIRLLVHLHPEEEIHIGDQLRFKVLPDFVAVMKEE
jgi:iron(III) transport system ATP-binding protein